jgi:hypothetical protein
VTRSGEEGREEQEQRSGGVAGERPTFGWYEPLDYAPGQKEGQPGTSAAKSPRLSPSLQEIWFMTFGWSNSMESSNDPRILIGIGKADEVETLVVRWPSGAITKQEHLKPGRNYSLVEPADAASGPSQPSTQRR